MDQLHSILLDIPCNIVIPREPLSQGLVNWVVRCGLNLRTIWQYMQKLKCTHHQSLRGRVLHMANPSPRLSPTGGPSAARWLANCTMCSSPRIVLVACCTKELALQCMSRGHKISTQNAGRTAEVNLAASRTFLACAQGVGPCIA